MVKAIIDKKQTTIDNDTGNVEVNMRGTVKGFAEGFRKYLKKENKFVQPDISVVCGALPEGHAHEGQFAVQINILPLPSEEDAITLADRITPIIEGFFNAKAMRAQ